MTCTICGALLPAPNPDSVVPIAWVDGAAFGACAAHFPLDTDDDAAYMAAYARFVEAAVERSESEAQIRSESAPGSP